jgi:hypothetical protein
MATVARTQLTHCDGFRVESPDGLVGWVEEPWLDETGEATALAVRLLDGRRALLLAEDVVGLAAEGQEVFARAHGALLELGPPRLETIATDGARPALVTASWQTTGALLEAPPPPGLLRRTALSVRLWRLAPPPAADADPPWQSIALMLALIAVLVVVEITVAFVVAYLATGRAY